MASPAVAQGKNGKPTVMTGFCGTRVIYDYQRPLKRLPTISELPKSGQLPFAPSDLNVSALQLPGRHLLFAGVAVRFQFATYGKAHLDLGWAVQIVQSPITADESVGQPTFEGTSKVRDLGPGDPVQTIQGGKLVALGSYRVELKIFDDAGKLLGSYGEYIRAVPSVFNVGLSLDRGVVRAGTSLKMRIENFGTREVHYGPGFELARFASGRWIKLNLPPTPVQPVEHVAFAGTSSGCEAVPVPRLASPGRYRVRRLVYPLGRSSRHGRFVQALFRVKP
jgi:hypothetical protein